MSPEGGYTSPVHWRLKEQRYRLVGEICPHCSVKLFPPRDICPNCNNEAKNPYKFSGRGEIYSFTTVYDPPAGHEENAPYVVALIKLEEGPMVAAQLTDIGKQTFDIGTQVEMVVRKIKTEGEETGLIVYGYKFRIAGEIPNPSSNGNQA